MTQPSPHVSRIVDYYVSKRGSFDNTSKLLLINAFLEDYYGKFKSFKDLLTLLNHKNGSSAIILKVLDYLNLAKAMVFRLPKLKSPDSMGTLSHGVPDGKKEVDLLLAAYWPLCLILSALNGHIRQQIEIEINRLNNGGSPMDENRIPYLDEILDELSAELSSDALIFSAIVHPVAAPNSSWEKCFNSHSKREILEYIREPDFSESAY
jgi:hypothetical protein